MKVVLITGSSKGIGLGLAKEFLKKDCAVVISARGKEKLDQEVVNLGNDFESDRVMGKTCDMSDFDQVEALWNAAKENLVKLIYGSIMPVFQIEKRCCGNWIQKR